MHLNQLRSCVQTPTLVNTRYGILAKTGNVAIVLIILTDGATITNHMRHCRSRSRETRFSCFISKNKRFLVPKNAQFLSGNCVN